MIRILLICIALSGCSRSLGGQASAQGGVLVLVSECFGYCETQVLDGSDALINRDKTTATTQ